MAAQLAVWKKMPLTMSHPTNSQRSEDLGKARLCINLAINARRGYRDVWRSIISR